VAWVIQRTAPQEPTTFWGVLDRWVARPPATKTAQVGKFRVPTTAVRFQDWDAAYQVADWLRSNQPLAHGEVIAVISEPEP
jgi:hypothetical protein